MQSSGSTSLPAWVLSAMLVLCALAGYPRPARACSSCSVGDPTLTVMGTEAPVAQRVRAALTVRHRRDAVGEPHVDELRLAEQRYEAAVSYAPIDRLALSVGMPLVHRRIDTLTAAPEDSWGPGDIDVRMRVLAYRDRPFAPRHLLGVVVGIELPTRIERSEPAQAINALVAKHAGGGVVDPSLAHAGSLELMAGSGSFDPLVGLTYSLLRDPYSLHVASILLVPTVGHFGSRGGPSLRTSLFAQYQPVRAFGARL
ncbi:MAG: hypothetical protein H5U40_12530, partial [Polyangiaceae bacterium]|nr:hypothetical protein [Polyangiaceae bacterium]